MPVYMYTDEASTVHKGDEEKMDTDDLEPITKKPQKKDLSRMSIEDLKEYIEELRGEITRAEDAIAKKNEAREGAESFFKS